MMGSIVVFVLHTQLKEILWYLFLSFYALQIVEYKTNSLLVIILSFPAFFFFLTSKEDFKMDMHLPRHFL